MVAEKHTHIHIYAHIFTSNSKHHPSERAASTQSRSRAACSTRSGRRVATEANRLFMFKKNFKQKMALAHEFKRNNRQAQERHQFASPVWRRLWMQVAQEPLEQERQHAHVEKGIKCFEQHVHSHCKEEFDNNLVSRLLIQEHEADAGSQQANNEWTPRLWQRQVRGRQVSRQQTPRLPARDPRR